MAHDHLISFVLDFLKWLIKKETPTVVTQESEEWLLSQQLKDSF